MLIAIKKIWGEISELGVNPELTVGVRKKVILSNQVAFIFLIAIVLFTIAFVLQKNYAPFFTLSLLFITALPVLFFNYFKKIYTSRLWIVIAFPLTMFIANIATKKAIKLGWIKSGINGNIEPFLSPLITIAGLIVLAATLLDTNKRVQQIIGGVILVICIITTPFLLDLLKISPKDFGILDFRFDVYQAFGIFVIFAMGAAFVFLQKINQTYENQLLNTTNRLNAANKDLEKRKIAIQEAQKELQLSLQQIENQRKEIQAKKTQLERDTSILEEQKDSLEDIIDDIESEQKKLTEINKVVEINNKNIESSISYAKKIHDSLLTSEELFIKYFKENFLLSFPVSGISGNFHWLQKTSNTIYFALIETGMYGVPGAFLSIICSEIFKKITSRHKEISLELLVENYNSLLWSNLQSFDLSSRKSRFYSAICSFEKLKKSNEVKINYIGDGIPAFILDDDVTKKISSKIFDLGKNETLKEVVKPETITVKKGAHFFIVTKSLFSQENKVGTSFGEDHLEMLIEAFANIPLGKQKMHLEKAISNHINQVKQKKDISVAGFSL